MEHQCTSVTIMLFVLTSNFLTNVRVNEVLMETASIAQEFASMTVVMGIAGKNFFQITLR